MNNRVKEFIEKVIKYIDNGDWYAVFDCWYQTTEESMWWNDHSDTQDLFDVLKVLDKSLENTVDIRKQLIKKYVEEDIVPSLLNGNRYITSTWYIRWSEVGARLKSSLGFYTPELHDIYDTINVANVTPNPKDQRFEVNI